MRKKIYTLVAFFMLISSNYAQNILSSAEIKTIQRQAKTLIENFEVVLNTVADPSLSNSTIENLIYNSYDGSNRLFENANVIVESDLDPKVIDRNDSKEIQDFNIAKYLTDFGLFIPKNISGVITFSNLTISPVTVKNDIFVNVFFKSKISGVEPESGIPFKSINRTSIIKAKKINNNWRCFIIGIKFCEPNLNIFDNRVEKEYSVFTEIIYPDSYELQFKDRIEKIFYNRTEVYYYDKLISLFDRQIKIENQDANYSCIDYQDSIKINQGDHTKIVINKNSDLITCINGNKSTYISKNKVNVVFDSKKSATIYNDKTQTKLRESVKNTYFSFPDENMVLVHGGSYMMGSMDDEKNDNKLHEVNINNFYIDKYEVTYDEFKTFIDETGYITDAERDGWSYIFTKKYEPEKKDNINWKFNVTGEKPTLSECNNPVVHITWNDAMAYAKWAGKRLPTEAEWEYASKGGGFSKNYDYSGSKKASDVAWYRNNSDRITHKAGQKLKNEINIYDMTGNVSEWCFDWYDENYYSNSPDENPQGPQTGDNKVVRGGSWFDKDEECTVYNRQSRLPGYRSSNIGFRCVINAKSENELLK